MTNSTRTELPAEKRLAGFDRNRMNQEMTFLRRLSRVGGFILRHWKKVMVGFAVAWCVWRFVL